MHSWTACWKTIWSLSLVDCHHWFQLHSSILYLDSDENHGQKRLCWTPSQDVAALCSGRLDGHGYNCPPLLAGRLTSHRKRKVHLSPQVCHFCARSSLATMPRLPWKQSMSHRSSCATSISTLNTCMHGPTTLWYPTLFHICPCSFSTQLEAEQGPVQYSGLGKHPTANYKQSLVLFVVLQWANPSKKHLPSSS